jgi:hypothetical protein
MIMATSDGAKRLLIPVIVGGVLGVILGFVSLLATAGGHGTYIPAALFFPAPLLLSIAVNAISKPALFVAAAQWPLYGAVVGLSARRGHTRMAIICLAVVQALLAVACFVFDRRDQFL